MVHGLETLRRLNAKAVASATREPKFALVSTVDSYVGNGMFAGVIDSQENTGEFTLDGKAFDTEAAVLEAFQDGLGPTEYFHVKPICAAT